MTWLQLSVAVSRDQAAAATECLEGAGAVAVTLRGDGEEVLLEPGPGEQPLWHLMRLEALLESGVDLKALQTELARSAARVVDVAFISGDDWQERWRAHAVRACFGGRLWLLPRDESVEPASLAEGAALLRLDPGLAFGSGSHPTTRLCLAGLASRRLEGQQVLDFGCGSGVLALAACLLGAERVVAVDHDPQACLATRDNAAYNGIGPEQLLVLDPDELARTARDGTFDVVVANILANPLVTLADRLCGLTAEGGWLMLSGLLAEQEALIRAAYGNVDFGPAAREAEWIRLDGRRRMRPAQV